MGQHPQEQRGNKIVVVKRRVCLLTRCGIGKGESDLVQIHDPFYVGLVVYLIQRETVTVLKSTVRKADAYNLAELQGLNTHNDFVES